MEIPPVTSKWGQQLTFRSLTALCETWWLPADFGSLGGVRCCPSASAPNIATALFTAAVKHTAHPQALRLRTCGWQLACPRLLGTPGEVSKHQEKLPALSEGQVLILPGFTVPSTAGAQHRSP